MQSTIGPPMRKSSLGPLFSMHDRRNTLRRRGSDESFACGGFSGTNEQVIEEDQPLLVDQDRMQDHESGLNSELHQSHLSIHCPRLDVPSNDFRKTRLAELEEMNQLYELSGLGVQGTTKSKTLDASHMSMMPSIISSAIPSAIPSAMPLIIPELDSYDSIPRARVNVQQLPERPMTHKYQTAVRERKNVIRATNYVAALPQNPAAFRQNRNSTALLVPFPKSDSTKTGILERKVEPLASQMEICAQKASKEDLKDRSLLETTHKTDPSRTSRIRASGLFGHILRSRKSENESRTSISNPYKLSKPSPFLTLTPFPEADLQSEFEISSRMSFQSQLCNESDIHVNRVDSLPELCEITGGHVAGVYDHSSRKSHLLKSTSYSSLWYNTSASSVSSSTRSRDSACLPKVSDGPIAGVAQVHPIIAPMIREVRHSSSFLDFDDDGIEESNESKHIWRNISMSTMSKSTVGMKKLKGSFYYSLAPK
ncbi:hypothetical protein DFH28DRAFT_1122915 [Melampsora americana]|nr:hypothetical protein DFH28DRAFT_1122915 [Melampsora americana]